MNFQVPQFIEVEDKIFGPFSFKQFIYLAGGSSLSFFSYLLPIPLFIRLFPMVIFLALGIALAFYKVNDRPLINLLGSAFHYQTQRKLYIWKKSVPKQRDNQKISLNAPSQGTTISKLSPSRLKDLAWSLDIKEKI